MKLKHLVLSLSLSACSGKHVSFYPTNSPCVDAISANFYYAKCSSIQQKIETSMSEPSHPLMEVTCLEPKIETDWTQNKFYIMNTQTEGLVSGELIPVCMDINSMVFVKITSEQSSD